MPRITRPDWTPKLRHHKASGQALVRLPAPADPARAHPDDGRPLYLGAFGSAEAEARYRALVAAWHARQAEAAIGAPASAHTAPTSRIWLGSRGPSMSATPAACPT